jgi:hypothetical protein
MVTRIGLGDIGKMKADSAVVPVADTVCAKLPEPSPSNGEFGVGASGGGVGGLIVGFAVAGIGALISHKDAVPPCPPDAATPAAAAPVAKPKAAATTSFVTNNRHGTKPN